MSYSALVLQLEGELRGVAEKVAAVLNSLQHHFRC